MNLESLDGRIVPSGNPGDPPDTTPPANPGLPNPSDDFTDTQLMNVLALAETTGDYSAVQQYLLDTYGPGAAVENSDGDDSDAQPTAPLPPTTTIPLPTKPPFSPVPPVVLSNNLPYSTDQSQSTGRAATADEIAELKNIEAQVVAIDIAKVKIGQEQIEIAKARTGLAKAATAATVCLANAQVELAQALSAWNQDKNSALIEQSLNKAQGKVAGAQAALDMINTLQLNAGQRIEYLDGKKLELDNLRVKLIARRDAILSALTRNVDSGPVLKYTLPIFIDWNSGDWSDYTKSIATLNGQPIGE